MKDINRRIIFLKELVDNSDLRYTTFIFNEEFFIIKGTKNYFSSIKVSSGNDIDRERYSKKYFPKASMVDDLDEGVINLCKKESIEALFLLTEEERYRYFAIRIFSEFHKNVLRNYLERIWAAIEKHYISNPELLLTILEIEGKGSRTIPILLDMNRRMMLHPDQEEQLEEILLQLKIESEFSTLRNQLNTIGKEELTNSLNTIESGFEERIKLITSGWEKKHNDLLKQIREHDTIVTDERKESLQKQIEQLDKRIGESFTNTRLFLIFISIIFTLIAGAYLGLTGWLISLLVKLVGV